MKCYFEIPTTFKGEDVILVVTELDYTPGQAQTYHQEGWPEMIDIVDGYVFDNKGNELNIMEELLDDKMDYIIDELWGLYHQEAH